MSKIDILIVLGCGFALKQYYTIFVETYICLNLIVHAIGYTVYTNQTVENARWNGWKQYLLGKMSNCWPFLFKMEGASRQEIL